MTEKYRNIQHKLTRFFKCRHLVWLTVLCIALAGCKDDFDDSELRKQIADLDGRLTTLEKLCAQMNANISSMQTIVNALQQNDYITGVTPITEEDNTIGYSITFAKNKPITIYHGENGSTPVIGIKKDTDGIYYWTLDGEWLLDISDNKIKAEGTDGEKGGQGEEGKPGQNGITPLLKIEEGYWYVSYDNENSWQQLGKASGEKGEPGEKGDSMFSSVDTSNDGYVIFTLADGTELKLPRKDSFGISFSPALPGISAGETIEIGYTLPQGDEKILVKTVCSNGWQAVVNKQDHTSGTITITAPDPITDDEVLVFVSDGKEKTVMSAISFCIVILDNIQDNTVKVGGGDGNLTLEITSNMEIKAVPQNEWIITDEQPQSKALATNHFHFKILANGDKQNRTGHIEVQDMGGKVLKTITVIQGNALEEEIAKEREALIAFYHATNGDQWKNNTNWCSDKPVSEWYGLTIENGYVTQLILTENNLSGYLPECIGELQHLTDISLWENYNLGGKLPAGLFSLENLKSLYIQMCAFEGEISPDIKQLTKLESLSIGNNKFTGRFPSEIGELKNLYHLSIANADHIYGNESQPINCNNFTPCEFPKSLCKLTNLKELYAYKNNFYGNIPSEIGQLKNLTQLILQCNRLSGNISIEICSLPNLEILYLHYNDLTGELPREIGNLKKLEQLNLQNNLLEGSIPNEICTLPNLRTLYLQNYEHNLNPSGKVNYNKFSGEIPADIGNLTELRQLALYNNNLTGNLPASMQNLENLVYCELRGNRLSGEIPVEITTKRFWQRLNAQETILPQQEGYVLTIADDKPDGGSTDYSRDGEVTLIYQAAKGNGINIVMLGDGFNDKDIENGKYDEVLEKASEHLFTEEPMKSLKEYFNVYSVKVVSAFSDVDAGDSALGTIFYGGTHVGGNDSKCFEYAEKVEGINLNKSVVVVIMNSPTYAGTCYLYSDNRAIAYFPLGTDDEMFGQLVNHEAVGHGFGKLGDEYFYTGYGKITPEAIASHQQLVELGWEANVDVTNDPHAIQWAAFLSDNRYKNLVGIYEGAMTFEHGIYRPTEYSIMRYNTGGFNAPSRNAIYKRVMELAGENYSYEKFVEYDAINRSSSARMAYKTACQKAAGKKFVPLHPPVIIRK